jgi:hypothetical protein
LKWAYNEFFEGQKAVYEKSSFIGLIGFEGRKRIYLKQIQRIKLIEPIGQATQND